MMMVIMMSVNIMLTIASTGESLNHVFYRSCAKIQSKIRRIFIILKLILIGTSHQSITVAQVAWTCYLLPTSNCFNNISSHIRRLLLVVVTVVVVVVEVVVEVVEPTFTHLVITLMLVRVWEEIRVSCHQKRKECLQLYGN